MPLRFRFDRTPTVQAPRPQRDTVCVRLQDGREVRWLPNARAGTAVFRFEHD